MFPEGYHQVIPYIIMNNASDFFGFMKIVFDAQEISRHMRDEKLIMHGEIKVGDSVIMFADATEQFPQRTCDFLCMLKMQMKHTRKPWPPEPNQ